MNKDEFETKLKEYKNEIGLWKIEIGNLTEADFVLGYGYDEKSQQWIVYENNERGMKYESFFLREEEAMQKLLKNVLFHYKMSRSNI